MLKNQNLLGFVKKPDRFAAKHVCKFIYLTCLAVSAAPNEVYVFFRGFHFNTSFTEDNINKIVRESKQRNFQGIDCLSKYSAENELDENACSRLSNDFAKLYEQGSMKFQTGNSNSTKRDFRSPMHAVQEMYVQHHDLFQEKLEDRTSELSQMLLETTDITTGEYINSNFLVSTSLDPCSALKFCAGSCSDQARKPEKRNGRFINSLLGYLDIFVVPLDEIKILNPFFVAEEFATLGITINNASRKPYHKYAEVNFPFHIPGKYHRYRYFLDVSKESSFNKSENCKFTDLDKRLESITEKLNAIVSFILCTNGYSRIFSGSIMRSLSKITHFMPDKLKEFRKTIEHLRDSLKTNNPRCNSIQINLNEFCININAFCERFYNPTLDSQEGMFTAFQAVRYLGDFLDYNTNSPLPGYFNLHINLSNLNLNDPEIEKFIPIILSAKNVKAIKILGGDESIYWYDIDYRGIEKDLGIEDKKQLCEEEFPWTEIKDCPTMIKLLKLVGESIHPEADFSLDLTGNSFSEDDLHSASETINNHKPNSYIEVIDDNLSENEAEEEAFKVMKEHLQELIEEEEESEPSETYSEYCERNSDADSEESNVPVHTNNYESSSDKTESNSSEYEEETEEESEKSEEELEESEEETEEYEEDQLTN
ncbi:hypothetical protein [Candidatus Nesciobacter abundans]|uniref:Uncharacterized protein n=1 Tax=Candidatus Nesciobacter abundans TaxID=2601668 RepID=A0A5C0UIC3_9PROT|nr:hypothetical protein [Candidatus Nesciobacter abundans]QEK39162.1 hypothetical protein FZC36_01800 [Candidatus Nesciobacter abundans]